MVPFARVPDLVVQPESWFELGNPNVETVCIDLAYRWPGGGLPDLHLGRRPVAEPAPGDRHELRELVPRRCCARGAASTGSTRASPTWATPGPRTGGTRPAPPLPDRLRPLAPRVLPLMRPGADDRAIADDAGHQPGRRRGDLPPPPARRRPASPGRERTARSRPDRSTGGVAAMPDRSIDDRRLVPGRCSTTPRRRGSGWPGLGVRDAERGRPRPPRPRRAAAAGVGHAPAGRCSSTRSCPAAPTPAWR